MIDNSAQRVHVVPDAKLCHAADFLGKDVQMPIGLEALTYIFTGFFALINALMNLPSTSDAIEAVSTP